MNEAWARTEAPDRTRPAAPARRIFFMGVSAGYADQTSRIIMRKAALKTAPTAVAAARFTMISTFGSVATLMVQPPLVAQAGSDPMVMIFLALAAPPTAA